jgi:hypothetical protein
MGYFSTNSVVWWVTILHDSESTLLYRKSAQENYGFAMEFLTLCIQYNSRIHVQNNVDEITLICLIVNLSLFIGLFHNCREAIII